MRINRAEEVKLHLGVRKSTRNESTVFGSCNEKQRWSMKNIISFIAACHIMFDKISVFRLRNMYTYISTYIVILSHLIWYLPGTIWEWLNMNIWGSAFDKFRIQIFTNQSFNGIRHIPLNTIFISSYSAMVKTRTGEIEVVSLNPICTVEFVNPFEVQTLLSSRDL